MGCYVIAEIGINHNGDLDICRRLIAAAAIAGADAVKFQKRTVEAVYTPAELCKTREHPWGSTNGELKRRLELGKDDYLKIAIMCEEHGVEWFASCWDHASVNFIEQFEPPCYKVASASLTDEALLSYTCNMRRPMIISTGMSTLDEIDHAVQIVQSFGNDLTLMHCTSTYPAADDELNLACIHTLKERYGVPVGYSGHERGIATTVAAVALGATMIERHITLDRTMFGSDQSASLEPHGFARMVRDIRAVESAIGDGVKCVYDSELPIREKLRRCLT